MKTTFTIQGDFIELNKLLKASGLCATGGMAKIAIGQGLVQVDGLPELRKRYKVLKGQIIAFEGQLIEVA